MQCISGSRSVPALAAARHRTACASYSARPLQCARDNGVRRGAQCGRATLARPARQCPATARKALCSMPVQARCFHTGITTAVARSHSVFLPVHYRAGRRDKRRDASAGKRPGPGRSAARLRRDLRPGAQRADPRALAGGHGRPGHWVAGLPSGRYRRESRPRASHSRRALVSGAQAKFRHRGHLTESPARTGAGGQFGPMASPARFRRSGPSAGPRGPAIPAPGAAGRPARPARRRPPPGGPGPARSSQFSRDSGGAGDRPHGLAPAGRRWPAGPRSRGIAGMPRRWPRGAAGGNAGGIWLPGRPGKKNAAAAAPRARPPRAGLFFARPQQGRRPETGRAVQATVHAPGTAG
jgi:hypothetical protein